ncbi:bacteriocin-like protein [Chryseobacterium sp. G0201]
MKNLKKLNRNELKTISGNGLLDNIGGLVGGIRYIVLF